MVNLSQLEAAVVIIIISFSVTLLAGYNYNGGPGNADCYY